MDEQRRPLEQVKTREEDTSFDFKTLFEEKKAAPRGDAKPAEEVIDLVEQIPPPSGEDAEPLDLTDQALPDVLPDRPQEGAPPRGNAGDLFFVRDADHTEAPGEKAGPAGKASAFERLGAVPFDKDTLIGDDLRRLLEKEIEAAVSKKVAEMVEQIVRETVARVAEKAILQAIEALRTSLGVGMP